MVSLSNVSTRQYTTRPVVWSAPARGLWIANSDDDFVGMVEELPDSGYVLTVGGRQFGPFGSLSFAQDALTSRRHGRSSGHRDWNLFVTASVVGAICVVAVVAMILLVLR